MSASVVATKKKTKVSELQYSTTKLQLSEMNATEENSAVIISQKSKAEEMSASVVATKKKPMKVKAATSTKAKTGNPTYVKMVSTALSELKERRGSSRQAILKYMLAKYKVDVAVAQPRLNKTLKKMIEMGEVVAGAKAGTSGAGCYKLSPEAKMALKKENNASRKKEVSAGKKSAGGKKVAKTSVKGKILKNVKGKKSAAKGMKKVAKKAVKGKKEAKKSNVKKSATKPKKGAVKKPKKMAKQVAKKK